MKLEKHFETCLYKHLSSDYTIPIENQPAYTVANTLLCILPKQLDNIVQKSLNRFIDDTLRTQASGKHMQIERWVRGLITNLTIYDATNELYSTSKRKIDPVFMLQQSIYNELRYALNKANIYTPSEYNTLLTGLSRGIAEQIILLINDTEDMQYLHTKRPCIHGNYRIYAIKAEGAVKQLINNITSMKCYDKQKLIRDFAISTLRSKNTKIA